MDVPVQRSTVAFSTPPPLEPIICLAQKVTTFEPSARSFQVSMFQVPRSRLQVTVPTCSLSVPALVLLYPQNLSLRSLLSRSPPACFHSYSSTPTSTQYHRVSIPIVIHALGSPVMLTFCPPHPACLSYADLRIRILVRSLLAWPYPHGGPQSHTLYFDATLTQP